MHLWEPSILGGKFTNYTQEAYNDHFCIHSSVMPGLTYNSCYFLDSIKRWIDAAFPLRDSNTCINVRCTTIFITSAIITNHHFNCLYFSQRVARVEFDN